MKTTTETLTLNFRRFLNEDINESSLGVVKTGAGLSVSYVLIDTSALLSFYKTLDPENPDIKKKDLIENNIVVSAIRIAENTEELKSEYGACMDASHVKVSAVNKNLKGKGYGRLLYKIIMSEHPEGLTPDRDFVSSTALKAWDKMSSDLKTKTIKDPESGKIYGQFDDIKNPKTATREDDCVVHPEYDGNPLNKAYVYSGENTDTYLMKAHEALASCEEMIPNGWTIESLEDLIVNAGMTLYDIAIGYEGALQESRLSKVWKSRAKARARRSGRPYDKNDLKWAHERQKMTNKEPELEQLYLREIEAATEASKATKEYLLKMREIRKKRLEEREKAKLGHPQDKLKYNKSKKAEKPPKSNKRGIAAIKDKAKQAHVFAGASAPGGGAAMMEEELQLENYLLELGLIPKEEKGDGNK